MRSAHHLTLALLAWSFSLVVSGACTSGPSPEEQPRPITRPASREEERTLISADSEVFEAVVRAQLAAGDDERRFRVEPLRFDPRPYGTSSGYPEIFAGVQGIDPTLSFPRAGSRAIRRLVENRKRILRANRAKEGVRVVYNQCAGAKVPAPPPARGSAAGPKKRANVYAGCPKSPEYYMTVGLPIRGQPEGLRNMRDTRGDRGSLRGDVWTALVDVHYAGPNGWRTSQYAWLFRRDGTGRPELARTILVSVVE